MLLKKLEIYVAVVAPIGTRYDEFVTALGDGLQAAGYRVQTHKLSDGIAGLAKSCGREDTVPTDRVERIRKLMELSVPVVERFGRDALVKAALVGLKEARKAAGPEEPVAHVFVTVKRPEEIVLLRNLYGPALYVAGLHASTQERRRYARDILGMGEEQCREFFLLDQSSSAGLEQDTRKAFQMCDVFLPATGNRAQPAVERFTDLLLGCPFITPTSEEHGMFLAFAAAIRSGSLARQVGAAVVSPRGEILSTGHNDVPAGGGGLYCADDDDDARDYVRGYDANDRVKEALLDEIASEIAGELLSVDDVRAAVERTRFRDLTEFGRDVHAEMEALLSAARVGVSVRGADLFSTTYPCHNCAKHIVAAGIRRVVYVEPYPKSRALELFEGTIVEGGHLRDRVVVFQPFVGVAARRYVDLFSLTLGVGGALERKRDGLRATWERKEGRLRTPVDPVGVASREAASIESLSGAINGDRP